MNIASNSVWALPTTYESNYLKLLYFFSKILPKYEDEQAPGSAAISSAMLNNKHKQRDFGGRYNNGITVNGTHIWLLSQIADFESDTQDPCSPDYSYLKIGEQRGFEWTDLTFPKSK